MGEVTLIPGLFDVYGGRERYRDALSVLETLVREGHAAFFVGGAVRDALDFRLSGRSLPPDVDFDIACDAPPERVAALFPRVVPVGAAFGVARVMVGSTCVEVARFRADEGYSDGRRPDRVRPASIREDAARRDFTVNALYYSPLTSELHDYHGGRADLERRVLRFIGDAAERIEEDRLRMLRAVRLACLRELSLDPSAFEAVRAAAPRVLSVSAERIARELELMFSSPRRSCCLELLDAVGLLAVVLPEVEALKGVPQPERFHPEGDVFTHTVLTFAELPPDADFALALAALLHDAGKPATLRVADRIRFDRHDAEGAALARRVCERLKLPARTTEKVVWLVATHMKYMDLKRMRKGRALAFLMHEWGPDSLALHRADCLASHGDLSAWRYARALLDSFEEKPAPLVKGEDVLALGVPPGPLVGEILKEAWNRQVEQGWTDRETALAALPSIVEEIARKKEDEHGN